MSAAHDPESIQWTMVRVNEDATVVCVEFRARNAFGALVKQFGVVTSQGLSNDPKVWNKKCLGQMYEETSATFFARAK